MIDKSTGRRKRGAAVLLALAGALALATAGCGGQSADQKALESYANTVCVDIANWSTQVKGIATDFSAGISRASLQSKVTQVESATKSLVQKIKAVPPPNTTDGQAAKKQLDQLSTELSTTAASAKSVVTGLQANASAGTVAAAVLTLAPQVKNLASSAQSTISTLKSHKGNVSSAFKSAESCKSLNSGSSS